MNKKVLCGAMTLLSGTASLSGMTLIEALFNQTELHDSFNTAKKYCESGTELHAAAVHGDEQAVKALLSENHLLLNQRNGTVMPIHCALLGGNGKVFSILIDSGAYPEVRDGLNQTAIHYAVALDNTAVLAMLLNLAIDADVESWKGTPLMYASALGKTEAAKALIAYKVKLQLPRTLQLAAAFDSTDIIDMLVSEGGEHILVNEYNTMYAKAIFCLAIRRIASPEQHVGLNQHMFRPLLRKTIEQNNALKMRLDLYDAILGNNLAKIKELLKYGLVDHSAFAEGSLGPVHVAALLDDNKILEALENSFSLSSDKTTTPRACSIQLHPMDCYIIRPQIYWTPLHAAIFANQKGNLDLLLASGKYLNVRNMCGQTPLNFAVFFGDASLIEKILALKPDIDSRDCAGATLLHVAVEFRETEVVELLLKHGADPEAKSEMRFMGHVQVQGPIYRLDKLTPFDGALHRKRADVVKLMIKSSTDVNKGDTPMLYRAVEHGDFEAVRMLLLAGAKLDVRAENGFMPLHSAVAQNNTELVQYLLKAGTNANVKGKNDLTALHLAAMNKNNRLVRDLVSAGATISASDTSIGFKRQPIQISMGLLDRDNIIFLLAEGAYEPVKGEVICEAELKTLNDCVQKNRTEILSEVALNNHLCVADMQLLETCIGEKMQAGQTLVLIIFTVIIMTCLERVTRCCRR